MRWAKTAVTANSPTMIRARPRLRRDSFIDATVTVPPRPCIDPTRGHSTAELRIDVRLEIDNPNQPPRTVFATGQLTALETLANRIRTHSQIWRGFFRRQELWKWH